MDEKYKVIELSDKDLVRIAELETEFRKPIAEILRRPKEMWVEYFVEALGITLEEKRRWSRAIFGQADVMQFAPCVSCKRLFEPRSKQHEYCDECAKERRYGACTYCLRVYEITNPYEAPWEFDGFCSARCRNFCAQEESDIKLYNWFNSFRIDGYLNIGLDDGHVINGIAKKDLPDQPWVVIKKWIEARDGNRCRNIGCDRPYIFICVHHIDSDRSHNTCENLITLCRRCHSYVTLHIENISYFFD